MADWSWRSLGDLQVGDGVLAVERPDPPGAPLKVVRTTVTASATRLAETVLVNGDLRCTPDHRFWLTGRDESGRHSLHSGWRAVTRALGKLALFVADPPPKLDRDLYERGWLAGMADGDGCFWTLRTGRQAVRRFRLAVKDEELIDRFELFSSTQRFELRRGVHRNGRRSFKPGGTMTALWLTRHAEALRFEAWLSEDVDDDAWRWGYVGGIIDAEGSFSYGVLRIAQDRVASKPTYERIRSVLDGLQLRHTAERKGFYVHRRFGQAWQVMSSALPAKPSIHGGSIGHHPHAGRVIALVAATGQMEPVVSLTTAAGSFIAGGYVVKNCDTPFSWDWSRYDPKVELTEQSVDEILAKLDGMGVEMVVVTGGEPLLQQRALRPLLEQIKARGWRVEIETAGTLAWEQPLELVDQFNVSPKLENSGNPLEHRYKPDMLRGFEADGRAIFKFVVTEPDELDEVASIVDECQLTDIWVMPEGTDVETLTARQRALAPAVLERGWNLTTRLHILLWGDRRGV